MMLEGVSINTEQTYIVAGTKSWNRRVFDETIRKLPGFWHYVSGPEELTLGRLREIGPRYIFFLHWSAIVSEEILGEFECVCFHMTDVPYGRGGSPLQNLISRGHRKTKLTALRMTGELDAGPVYCKEELCLEGAAEEIFIRAMRFSAQMIACIVATEPGPVPQSGDPVRFKRRQPKESMIDKADSLLSLFDFIRMLDADGYPCAFIDHEGFRYTFNRAALRDGQILADVRIEALQEED